MTNRFVRLVRADLIISFYHGRLGLLNFPITWLPPNVKRELGVDAELGETLYPLL